MLLTRYATSPVFQASPHEIYRPCVALALASIGYLEAFRPGAFGLPNRGDISFAVCTRWSSSDFGTFRIFRMALLNLRNSGDVSNCCAVMGGRSSVSPAPAVLLFGRSAMLFRSL